MDFIHGMSAQDLGGLLAGSMGVIGVAIWWIMEHHVLKGSDKIEEAISLCLQQAETLKQSILKKAFEGKLI